MLFQSIVLSQIQLYGYFNPYVYPLLILLIPAHTSRWNQLLLGTVLGGLMDLQMMSGGVHLMASSLLAYLRPYILNFIVPRAKEEKLGITMYDIGLEKFALILGVGALIHHAYLFLVDANSLSQVLGLILRTAVSTFGSFAVMVSLGFLIKPRKP